MSNDRNKLPYNTRGLTYCAYQSCPGKILLTSDYISKYGYRWLCKKHKDVCLKTKES